MWMNKLGLNRSCRILCKGGIILKVIKYKEVKDFLIGAQKFLEETESVNNVILGTCFKLASNPGNIEKQPYFAVVSDENRILLTAMITPPFPIALYSNKVDITEAIELIVQNLIAEKWTVSGVIAPLELSQLFARIWAQNTGCDLIKGLDMRVYELVKVNKVHISSGKFRIGEKSDLEIISRWIIDLEKDEGSNITEEKAIEIAQDKIKNKQLYIWEDKKPVSMACTARETKNGIVVNMVYTPKEYRRNGYASSCVATLSQYLLDKGYKFCSLFTDLSNTTSNEIYMRIGYKAVSDFQGYSFE